MHKNNAGFTLIEVLVAMVIFSVMATGFLGYTGQQARQADYLAKKTLASLVASNLITTIQVNKQWPEPGEKKERITMNGRTWQASIHIQKTVAADFRRLEVRVSELDKTQKASQPLITLVGFVGKH